MNLLVLGFLNSVSIIKYIALAAAGIRFFHKLIFNIVSLLPDREHGFTNFFNGLVDRRRLTNLLRIIVGFFYLAVVDSGKGQYNTQVDIGQGPFNGITTFQHGDIGFQYRR